MPCKHTNSFVIPGFDPEYQGKIIIFTDREMADQVRHDGIKLRMKKKNITLLISLSFFVNSFAQESEQENLSTLLLYQDTLNTLQHFIYKGKNDIEKYKVNKKFIQLFENALNTKNSFDFSFDSLTSIARLVSTDKKFKIYNWNLPKSDGTFEYFGFIQTYNSKTKETNIYKLTDKSEEVKNAERYSSDHTKWYGMLYYKIIEKKYKKKTIYTLLAWDGNDKILSKKIIDVLSFSSDGTPTFGSAIFEMGKKTPQRVVFEYSADLVMSLKYDEKKGMIIFDHLAPANDRLKGHPEFYGPDFSYDAFEFKKGKWVYLEDIDARNKKNKNDQFYQKPTEILAPTNNK